MRGAACCPVFLKDTRVLTETLREEREQEHGTGRGKWLLYSFGILGCVVWAQEEWQEPELWRQSPQAELPAHVCNS